MTKDEALDLALEALEQIASAMPFPVGSRAITAIKQALAAQPAVQEPHKCLSEQMAQATNGRVRIDPVTGNVGIGTAPVQEPVAWVTDLEFDFDTELIPARRKGKLGTADMTIPLYTTPPAPAVQEPLGYLEIDDIESQREYPHNCRNVNLWHEGGQGMAAIYTTPPAAQPAIPDALTSADIQEHIEYVAGWNDCRQAMIKMMK